MENKNDTLKEIDIDKFCPDEDIKKLIHRLMSEIERLVRENKDLKEENQRLRNEIARIKGYSPKPEIKPSKENNDTEAPKRRREQGKEGDIEVNKTIRIDRKEKVEPIKKCECGNCNPKRFHSKGQREVVIQDIKITTNNIAYELGKIECLKCGRIIEADIPSEIKGRYGNELKTWVSYFKYELRVPENKIYTLLQEIGMVISEAEISKILLENGEKLSYETEEIKKTGLLNSTYVNMDETGWRREGNNKHVWYIGNTKFSAYEIHDKRNSETAKAVLEIENDKTKKIVVVHDDFSAYSNLSVLASGLCFLHEIRLFEKLIPYFDHHAERLNKKIGELWDVYDALKAYRLDPDSKTKARIENMFDRTLQEETGFEDLDHRLALTCAKKERLLTCLEYPEVPPENNCAERGLRHVVIIRKISGGSRSKQGEKSLINHLTVFDTCKKLGIRIKDYLYCFISGLYPEVKCSALLKPG